MTDKVEKALQTTDDPNPNQEGFSEKVTPKEIPDDVFLFECPKVVDGKRCNNTHVRHAGYVQELIPFIRSGGEKRVANEKRQVMVCTKCRACYIWINEQMYDITDKIDLEAWEKLEREMDNATGPGGEC